MAGDHCPHIKMIADAIRSALPEACAVEGTINEYPLARAVEKALRTQSPNNGEQQ